MPAWYSRRGRSVFQHFDDFLSAIANAQSWTIRRSDELTLHDVVNERSAPEHRSQA